MSSSKDLGKLNKYLMKIYKAGLDSNNKCMLKKGDIHIAIVAAPQDDLLLVSSPLISLPEENLLPLFRKLLTMNFSDTKDAFFAINENAGTIDVQIKRPLANLDYGELERAVNTVIDISYKNSKIIAETFGAEAVNPLSPKITTWRLYISSLKPFAAVARKKDQEQNIKKVRIIFSLLGLVFGIGAGIYTYVYYREWALAVFVFLWTYYIFFRMIPDLITDPNKIKRFFFFALHPALGVAILIFTYQWWGIWWLSALLGYLGGMLIGRLMASLILPKIDREEAIDERRRLEEQRKSKQAR